jgi:DNA-directed RNA polymerase subunit RPC12/RpoP
MSTFTRDHTCMECGHKWTAPVTYGYTQNLTGEVTLPCNQCGSKSISSGPIPIVVEVDKGVNRVTRALQVLGYRDARNAFEYNEEPIFKVVLSLREEDKLVFYLEQHEVEYRVLGSPIMRKKVKWGVSVEHTTPGTHWEPDDTDLMEIADGASVESALVEAVLSYFRNTLYDCMPQTDPDLDITKEDIPQ